MISTYRLPLYFDSRALQEDLAQILPNEWVAHFNKEYFDGQWTGVSLRSADGSAERLYTGTENSRAFSDSPLLDRCPNIQAVLKSINCPLRAVRFLKLAAGSIIHEHRDFDLGFAEGVIRLHIPVTTNPDIDFFVDAHRVEMKPGECWYLDLSLPHWVENRGSTDRVHLVVDCELNGWLQNLLPVNKSGDYTAALPTPAAELSSVAELDRFRVAVLGDLTLQRRLQQTSDRQSFIRLVIEIAHKSGYSFAAADVERAMQQAQIAWLQRWID